MKKKILISLMVLSLCFNMGIYSFATSVKELEQQKSDAKEQKDRLEDEKDEVEQKKSEAMKKVEELDSQIADGEDKLDELNSKIKELETSISSKEKEIKDAEKKQKEQEETLEKRLIAQYKNLHNMEKIAKIDKELIDTIEKDKKNLTKAKEELTTKKSEIKTSKAEAEKENVKLKNSKALKNSEISKLSDEEKQLQEKIEQFNNEIKKAEADIRKALASANSQYQGSFSGTLSWPLSTNSARYNIITSGYGKRDQPTAGASTNHKALDIGVRYQPVFAPADGYVVTAGKVSGYGNFIMIKHSNSLYTCYGHLASFNVSAGQTVTRGQQIAYLNK